LGKLTPREFQDMVEGYMWKREMEQDQRMFENSIMASWISMPHMKKPLDASKLFKAYLDAKKPKENKKKKTTEEESKNLLKELVADIGDSSLKLEE
jgi:hypothetical protein